MNYTLGYIKDLIAFIFSIIFIIIFFILKNPLPRIYIYFIIISIFIFDGIFTLLPHLHNFDITKITY